ncbi:MAG: hypothetical protein P8X85_23680 [Desulfobacterales bacterium]
MIKKSIIIGLSALSLICTSAYAQGWKDGWRNSPLTSKTSNEWRHKPYTTKPSDSWRSSPFSARQSESKLRWNKGKWQNSPSYWRNNPYVERPIASDKWQNRWDKRKWRYSPLNWRNSELRYKNVIRRYESESVIQEVREWVPSDVESEKESVPEKKKEYAKAQIETIAEEGETISEKAPYKSGHADNYFTVISGKQTYRIEKNVQKTVHMAQGGLVEIYSSNAENH